jgi:hypothetical protein
VLHIIVNIWKESMTKSLSVQYEKVYILATGLHGSGTTTSVAFKEIRGAGSNLEHGEYRVHGFTIKERIKYRWYKLRLI